MNAIVLDGNQKSALSIVRSLGRKGVYLSVGAMRGTSMAMFSRYASARFTYPSPYENQDGFITAVKKEAEHMGGKPVVYACSDATLLSLYIHREMLAESMTLVFPPEASMELAFNKAATYSLTKVSGIPTIATYLPETYEDIERLSESIAYPTVMKPRRSVTWHEGVGIFGTASFIYTKEALKNEWSTLKQKLGEAPLVQDFVRGEEYGVEMLAHAGKPYALLVHHRIRSLNPTGGASVLKETLTSGDLHDLLVSYALRIVEKLLWEGPIMVEFKVDEDTREPKLMELNGRFWGSLPLSIAAGVDMPYIYYRALATDDLPEVTVVTHNEVTTRHFLGDCLHVYRVWFSQTPLRRHRFPGRLLALRNFFILPRGTMSDVWLHHDPLPTFMEVVDLINKYLWK